MEGIWYYFSPLIYRNPLEQHPQTKTIDNKKKAMTTRTTTTQQTYIQHRLDLIESRPSSVAAYEFNSTEIDIPERLKRLVDRLNAWVRVCGLIVPSLLVAFIDGKSIVFRALLRPTQSHTKFCISHTYDRMYRIIMKS